MTLSSTTLGDLTNDDANKELHLHCLVDERDTYSLDVTMAITKKRNTYEADPQIRLVWPGLQDPRITGSVTLNPGRKFEYALRFRNIWEQPAKATGSVTMINNANRQKLDVAFGIQGQQFNTDVSGFIDNQVSS